MTITKYHAFGLHITDTVLKLVEVVSAGNTFTPIAFGELPIPDGVVTDGMVNDVETVAGLIHQIRERPAWGKVTTDYVACSLPESRIFLKVISVPDFPQKQLDEAIAWEARALMPLPAEQAYFQTQILQRKENQVQVLVAATERKLVDAYLDTLTRAKLIPIALDLECNAIARTIGAEQFVKMTILQIHVGVKATSLTVFRQGKLLFSNTIPYGIYHLIKEIADNLAVNYDQGSIEYKRNGLARLTGKQTIDALGNGITSTIAFYNGSQTNDAEKVKQLVLAGSSAVLPGLIDKLKVFADALPIEVAKPKLLLFPQLLALGCTPIQTSMGLAIRGAYPAQFIADIDFLPESYIKSFEATELKNRSARLLAIFIYLVYLVGAVLGFAWFSLRNDTHAIQDSNANQQRINDGHEAKKQYAWINDQNALLTLLTAFESERLPYHKLLARFNQTVPTTVHLIDLSIDKDKKSIDIKGIGESREAILAFANKLAEEKMFKNIVFSYAGFDAEVNANFSATLNFDPKSL